MAAAVVAELGMQQVAVAQAGVYFQEAEEAEVEAQLGPGGVEVARGVEGVGEADAAPVEESVEFDALDEGHGPQRPVGVGEGEEVVDADAVVFVTHLAAIAARVEENVAEAVVVEQVLLLEHGVEEEAVVAAQARQEEVGAGQQVVALQGVVAEGGAVAEAQVEAPARVDVLQGPPADAEEVGAQVD